MPDDDSDRLRSRIRAVLLAEWDPSGADRFDAAHRTYDAYLDPLADLIQSDPGEEAIVAFLKERESEIMCFPALGVSHLKRVAKNLATLKR